MKHYTKWTSMAFFLMVFWACKEDINNLGLPPITQEGLNTFGCMINGEVFVPRDSPGGLMGSGPVKGLSGGMSYYQDGLFFFSLKAINPDYYYNNMYLYIHQLNNIGEYELGQSNASFSMGPEHPHAIVSSYLNEEIFLSYKNSGKIIITRFDTLNGVISGRFEMKLYNKFSTSDSLIISDGRFDVNLGTLNQD